ncbi:hypothetical protein B0H16DRAFT_550044 [Mycena metata]|uniref:Uncharacterized protein n=1 Tax=Mycena metata TaxID=1033252 RepID=A0AAD7H5R6_9AGAR|nr:hypothetical protein B0H16DRAFT_550044 [Mycena metata]
MAPRGIPCIIPSRIEEHFLINQPSSSSPSTSSSRSSNHNTVIIAVVVVVVVLALVVLVLLLLMLRRRRQRKEAKMVDIARPQSTFAGDLGTSGTAIYNAWAPPLPSDAARFTTGPVSPRHEKRVRNGYLVPQRAWSDRRPSESNVNSNSNPPPSEAGSGSTWVAPGSDSDQAVSQRLQRQEAELEALRAEVRTLTQPPPSYE